MKYFYETLPLHELGEVAVSIRDDYEGGPDAPQRRKRTLTIKLWTFEEGYAANYGLMEDLRAALAKPDGRLQWTDEDAGTDHVNQTVTVVSANLPDEWGTYAQTAELVVYFYEQNLTPDNLPCSFQKDGSTKPFVFSNLVEWRPQTTVEHVHPLHSERRMQQQKIVFRGWILGDATLPPADRRKAMMKQARDLEKELTGAQGLWSLGTDGEFFKQTVRIEDFSAEVDQAVYSIPFSGTVLWTPFPNLADFAIVDFAAEQRDPQNGELFLSLTGKITASSEAKARTTLAALQTAVKAQYGFTTGQPLRNDATANAVDADTDGQVFTELSFTGEWRSWRPDNQTASFQNTTPGSGAIPLGQVRTFVFHYGATRFNVMRSQRDHAAGRIEAAGTWPCSNPDAPIASRRTELDAFYQQMMTAVNGADGTLTYRALPGGKQIVRVVEFHPEINQEYTGIDWNATFEWSLFPNEEGYATCEFTVTPRENAEDGDEFITLTGRCRATTKAVALAKLGTLRASVMTVYGYTVAQQIRAERSYNSIYANDDQTAGLTEPATDGSGETAQESAGTGTTFIELAFTEEYRRRAQDLVSIVARTSVRDDIPSGLRLTTISGSVTASGATVDAAYATARDKALATGQNQEAAVGTPTGLTASDNGFLRSSTITWDERQINIHPTGAPGGDAEFVRLEFSFEYQSKLGNGFAYHEINTETVTDPFGQDVVNVSGFIVAGAGNNESADQRMTDIYATITAPYATRLRRGERTSRSVVNTQKGVGTTTFPAATFTNSSQSLRLDFSFQIYNLKTKASYRYGVGVENDYLALQVNSRFHGSVWAATMGAATTAMTSLGATLGLGNLLRDNIDSARNYNTGDLNPDNTAAVAGAFERIDFDRQYVAVLAGVSGVLEMSLTEEVTYTGRRWVVQPTVEIEGSESTTGYDVPQSLSKAGGSRTVSGEVTAATLTTAESWAKTQRALLTGTYVQPERWSRQRVFLPRSNGTKVQLWKVRFTFSEILPNVAAP